MRIAEQVVIPAVRHIKDFEQALDMNFEYIVLLESYLTRLPSLIRRSTQADKKILVHADLVQGLKHDEAGAQFLVQMIKPAGLISTHTSVIAAAKKHGIISIQRVFLIDSHSLQTSLRILSNSQPDFVEVLPGVMPEVITELKSATSVPILAGGFIRTEKDIQLTLASGATAVTTSHRALWRQWNEFRRA